MLKWHWVWQLLVLLADEFSGLLSVNLNVGFSNNTATVMVVAAAWHLLATVGVGSGAKSWTKIGISSASQGRNIQIHRFLGLS